MARTTLSYVEPSKSGTVFPTATAVDVANGNQVLGNDGRIYVLATNSNVSTPRNLTVTLIATVDGQSVSSRTIPLPASTTLLCGPYEAANYGSTLQLNGDNATDVKLQLIHIPG